MTHEPDPDGGRFSKIAARDAAARESRTETNQRRVSNPEATGSGMVQWLRARLPLVSSPSHDSAESPTSTAIEYPHRFEGLTDELADTPLDRPESPTAEHEHHTTPRSDVLEQTSQDGPLQRGTRRKFLRTAATVGSAGVVLAAAGSGNAAAASADQPRERGYGQAQQAVSDTTAGTSGAAARQSDSSTPAANLPSRTEVLDYLLMVEHMEYALFRDALASSGGRFDEKTIERSEVAKRFAAEPLRYSTFQMFEQIREQDRAHVEKLASRITSAGGSPTDEASYSFEYEDVEEFTALAHTIKSVTTAAYTGSAPLLAEIAGSVPTYRFAPVEARHTAYLRTLDEQSPSPEAFESEETIASVTDTLQEYISA